MTGIPLGGAGAGRQSCAARLLLRLAFVLLAGIGLVLPPAALAASGEGQDEGLPRVLKGHGGPVKSVTVSPDGRMALTGSFDYSLILWEMSGEEGRILHRMIGHNAAVNDVVFVPNGAAPPVRAVSVSDDGSLGIWDLARGEAVKIISDTADKVLDADVSSDGRFAAAARWDGTARLYDLSDGQEVARFEGHRGNVNAVAFSRDSKLLFTASYDGDIRAWHVGPDADAAAASSGIQQGQVIHSNGWGVNVLAPLPDDRRIVFGTINGIVATVDPFSGAVQEAGSFERPILSLAVSEAAGWFAAGGGDGHIRVFDSENLLLIEDHNDPYGPVWGLSFTPDGKRVYRAGLDDFSGHWQVTPRKPFEVSQSQFPRRFQVSEADDPGEIEFRRKCSVCHTLTPDDGNRAGPTLHGVFGRKAGAVEGYPYSEALRDSDIVWTEETIGRLFDEGPDIVTPGSKMPVQRLKSIERRDALIAFLKEATRAER